jgi:hypothetical protein
MIKIISAEDLKKIPQDLKVKKEKALDKKKNKRILKDAHTTRKFLNKNLKLSKRYGEKSFYWHVKETCRYSDYKLLLNLIKEELTAGGYFIGSEGVSATCANDFWLEIKIY